MKQVFITGATGYQDLDLRTRLAITAIKEARKLGWKTILGDHSSAQVRKELEENGAIVLHAEKLGLGPQKRLAINKAMEVAGEKDIIITTEIERPTLIPLLPKVVASFNRGVGVIGRIDLTTYPPAQQYVEACGNKFFSMLTGKNLDVWFGPRVFTPDNARFFLNYVPGEDMWDSFFVPLLDVLVEDESLLCDCRVDFNYPPEQREAEEKDVEMQFKRLRQLNNIVPALYARAKTLGIIH